MNKLLIASVVAAVAGCYLLWQSLTPVEIVAVHDGNTILVRHFPYLKSRQIAWWEANKDMIELKYGVPKYKVYEGYKFYDVYIHDFGNGYRTEPEGDTLMFYTEEVLCFDDMTVKARCIDKSPLMSVSDSKNLGLKYYFYSGFFGSRIG
ncbi:DUF943 family protein [Lelliottia sp. SL45]|uniref:DUF943 family protein n=1 Tax=Lelliottia sp. SL45 TaxID=2994665 RepID=UPI0022725D0F|nr:DUF943 family protein [Lelliottia sp. SL45]MCY1701027.1 DUF943 family protein [Lelliottia sp. SL45]MCY1701041.1 DUF943 family protein [Lelliottia sp. SL45]